jgi:hypothetical protein
MQGTLLGEAEVRRNHDSDACAASASSARSAARARAGEASSITMFDEPTQEAASARARAVPLTAADDVDSIVTRFATRVFLSRLGSTRATNCPRCRTGIAK